MLCCNVSFKKPNDPTIYVNLNVGGHYCGFLFHPLDVGIGYGPGYLNLGIFSLYHLNLGDVNEARRVATHLM